MPCIKNLINKFYREFARQHAKIVLRTNGRPRFLTLTLRVFILVTKGRKSGKELRNPLVYYKTGESYVVLATNFGQDEPPAWSLNLRQQIAQEGGTAIYLSGKRMEMTARELQGEERERIYKEALAYNSQWRAYQAMTDRKIDIFMLEAK